MGSKVLVKKAVYIALKKVSMHFKLYCSYNIMTVGKKKDICTSGLGQVRMEDKG